MQSDSEPRNTPQVPHIYDDVGRHLGFIQHHGPDAVAALDAAARPIGTFPDERAAVTAVWRQAHGQRP